MTEQHAHWPTGDPVIRQKALRLQKGDSPRVLDLFSGCGGLSLGFRKAGFEIAAAVESDPVAARTHAINFHGADDRHAQPRDILGLGPRELTRALSLGRKQETFDVVVGGPPCQAFARIGRAKLREIAEHPDAFRHDPRAVLYLTYLEYVRQLKPLALVMENVPDVVSYAA